MLVAGDQGKALTRRGAILTRGRRQRSPDDQRTTGATGRSADRRREMVERQVDEAGSANNPQSTPGNEASGNWSAIRRRRGRRGRPRRRPALAVETQPESRPGQRQCGRGECSVHQGRIPRLRRVREDVIRGHAGDERSPSPQRSPPAQRQLRRVAASFPQFRTCLLLPSTLGCGSKLRQRGPRPGDRRDRTPRAAPVGARGGRESRCLRLDGLQALRPGQARARPGGERDPGPAGRGREAEPGRAQAS